MATIFKNTPDAFVREKVESNFRFLTGEARPMSKGTNKNADGITDEMWFHELSWVHCFIFCQAFHEATARGLFNTVEQAMAQECFDIINEMADGWK